MKLFLLATILSAVICDICCSDSPCTGMGLNRCNGTVGECCPKGACIKKRGTTGRPGDYTCSSNPVEQITDCTTCVREGQSFQAGFCNPRIECEDRSVACILKVEECQAWDKQEATRKACESATSCEACTTTSDCGWFTGSNEGKCYVADFWDTTGVVINGKDCGKEKSIPTELFDICGFNQQGTITGNITRLCSQQCFSALMSEGEEGEITNNYRNQLCGTSDSVPPTPVGDTVKPINAGVSQECAKDKDVLCQDYTTQGYNCAEPWMTANCGTTCCTTCEEDKDVDCGSYIGQGYSCSDDWMQENCRSTCCGSDGAPTSSIASGEGCGRDLDSTCEYWITNGGGSCLSSWAEINCKKTCCDSGAETTASVEVSTSGEFVGITASGETSASDETVSTSASTSSASGETVTGKSGASGGTVAGASGSSNEDTYASDETVASDESVSVPASAESFSPASAESASVSGESGSAE